MEAGGEQSKGAGRGRKGRRKGGKGRKKGGKRPKKEERAADADGSPGPRAGGRSGGKRGAGGAGRRKGGGGGRRGGGGGRSRWKAHMELATAMKAARDGLLLHGKLRINASRRTDAFVTVPGLKHDIFMGSMRARNRALDGDVVILALNPKDKWIDLEARAREAEEDRAAKLAAAWDGVSEEEGKAADGDGDAEGKADGAVADLSAAFEALDIREPTSALWQAKAIDAYDPLYDDSAEAEEEEEDAAMDDGPAGRRMKPLRGPTAMQRKLVATINETGKQATATVVAIAERTPLLDFVGYLKRDGAQIQLSPVDSRAPVCVVDPNGAPDDFMDDPKKYAKTLVNCRFRRWSEYCLLPDVTFTAAVGQAGELRTEVEALLQEYQVNHGEHPAETLEQLAVFAPAEGLDGAASTWTIPEEEIARRRDLRDTRIFTIDPPSAKDLDDALHVTPLPDGTFEIGVHIADVTYFVERASPLDMEASRRCTTVYLIGRAIPMLPRLLSETLCSLNPNVDRLAFSVIWKMAADGTLVDEEPWYGRTVIRSCAKLHYGIAQAMIDGLITEEAAMAGDVDAALWPADRLPVGHSMHDVYKDVHMFNSIAKNRRAHRERGGALKLGRVKLSYTLDTDGNPIGVGHYRIRDSNRLVEEYMLLANYLVAQKLLLSGKRWAVVRGHPEPLGKRLTETLEMAAAEGMPLQGATAGQLAASLRKLAEEHPDPMAAAVMEELLTRPMKPAEYMCAGVTTTPDAWHHYALSIPYYTHFTSPIRRYADCMVHRLLAAVLQTEPEPLRRFPIKSSTLAAICTRCNEKKMAAKRAQEGCDDVYLALFLRDRPMEATGIVMDMGIKTFTVLVPCLGLESRVYPEDNSCKPRRKGGDGPMEMLLQWDEDAGGHRKTLRFLSRVRVRLTMQQRGKARVSARVDILPGEPPSEEEEAAALRPIVGASLAAAAAADGGEESDEDGDAVSPDLIHASSAEFDDGAD